MNRNRQLQNSSDQKWNETWQIYKIQNNSNLKNSENGKLGMDFKYK